MKAKAKKSRDPLRGRGKLKTSRKASGTIWDFLMWAEGEPLRTPLIQKMDRNGVDK